MNSAMLSISSGELGALENYMIHPGFDNHHYCDWGWALNLDLDQAVNLADYSPLSCLSFKIS